MISVRMKFVTAFAFLPLASLAMEIEDHSRRDVSVVEAFMIPQFELSESKREVQFKCDDYKNKNVSYTMPLRSAAIIIYQSRRDKCAVDEFIKKLTLLADKLTHDSDIDLENEDISVFQNYRLHRFDSPSLELKNQQNMVLAELRKAQEDVPSYAKTKNMDSQRALLEKKYNEMIASRNAYNTAFCVGDLELIKLHMQSQMRYRPLNPLSKAINDLRVICRKKGKPFQLTEF